MPLPRILAIIVGLILVLGLLLWLVDSLYRLYSSVVWTSPFLGNLLLLLLILLIAIVIAASVYYAILFWKSNQLARRPKLKPKIPEAKTDAAAQYIRALEKQIPQIQDEVARQALLSRSREIEANLKRGNLRVVVFGTGSAGKTSLVNAVMGRVVGQVSAPMGTTTVGETYVLKLKGIQREILITDTPGILEAGVAGTEREQLARQLATEADLLLFVVDNDLRNSEYEPLRGLAEIGKRSLLVLNKIDLYTEQDKETILARLRDYLREFINPTDVIACAANPQPVQLENGLTVTSDSDVMPLIRRIAAVLRAEGDDLMADNILLQSQRLGEDARKLIDAQRRRQADKVVERFQWIGAGAIAVTPLPVVDLLATAAVNTQMVLEIGKIYGCELNVERGRELAFSLAKTLASLGIVKGAIDLISTALQLNLATYVVGKAIQGVTAAYLTRIAGKSFIEYFRHNQDWGDGGITEVVQRQFQLNRRDAFVKAFVAEAIARVVKPLTDNTQTQQPVEELEPPKR